MGDGNAIVPAQGTPEECYAGRSNHCGRVQPRRPRANWTPNLRRLSFGGPAAIVTSMGLIVGLNAATVGKTVILGSLLILALADNLTDSLNIHIYQESERLSQRQALVTTVANFATRLLVSLTFVALVLYCGSPAAIYLTIVWGLFLLSGLTYLLARERNVSPMAEICKHGGIAGGVEPAADGSKRGRVNDPHLMSDPWL